MDKQDVEIIECAKSGDEVAFQKLYHQYYQFVFYYAWKLCKNEADARDVTQDVFFEVYRSLPNLRDVDYFKSWLRKITSSKCQTLFRKHRDQVFDSEQISIELGKESRIDFIPDEQFNQRSEKAILRSLLEKIPTKRRIVLELFYLEEMSINEIAQRLHVNANTIKGRLHYARKSLLEEVEKFEKEEGRSLSFRLDVATPVFSMALLSKAQQFFSHSQILTGVQVIAISSTVIIGGTAVIESYELYKQAQGSHNEPVPYLKEEQEAVSEPILFTPVSYQEKTANNTNDAYFILMKFAANAEVLKEKSKEECKQIEPLVEELCQSDNAYKEVLQSNGWLATFYSII